MTGLVDWAAARARMVFAFILLSLTAGGFAYATLPKEGEPDIDIPALFISVSFPGISAEDSEKLLIRPMETELAELDGLDSISATAAEGYAGVLLEFEFGWDKQATIADVRDAMNGAQTAFPDGAETYSITEINFSEFPIIVVNLSGPVPERTLIRYAEDLQDRVESLEPILEAYLTGHREEMLEVVIDPLKLESYNITAGELIGVVRNNNRLIAAGDVVSDTGAFSVKIPSSFDEPADVFRLPVKTNGDRVVTLGDLADIRLTFKDRLGTARFNGETTVALQVVKRKGFNIIDTTAAIKSEVEAARATWPQELQQAIEVSTSNEQALTVQSMVRQLEGSVLTAVALVMIVVLAALGVRSALLVGFAIPTSFLLCFVLLAVMDIPVSNIVMFGLILAVGMLVDGAIVVVEYADKRIREGTGPMHAYVKAAKRMFWPIVSSTATTLCAFLPMLFWPGVPGEFMGKLPVTLIFVLSASLIVALVYLPVMGGISGRVSRAFGDASEALRRFPWWMRAVMVPPSLYLIFLGGMQTLNPGYLLGGPSPVGGIAALIPGALLFVLGASLTAITFEAARIRRSARTVEAGYRRSAFGSFVHLIVANPVMPIVTVAAVIGFVISVFLYFGENNNGTQFFVDTEPEQAIVYVRQRGNLSLQEMDAAVRTAEDVVRNTPGVDSVFAFAGTGGLNSNTGGAAAPRDTIGQIQIELSRWEERSHIPELDGDIVIANIQERLDALPGIRNEILNLARGPASAKPIHLRLKGNDWTALQEAAAIVRERFENTRGLIAIEDTTPLPGIDWQVNVDVEKAGRFSADVATVGVMVQLVTRGLLLDTMRVDSSDDEIDIRVRLPEDDRVLTTLDTLRVRTSDGLVPLSNFIDRKPVNKLGQIDRNDQQRYFDIRAGVESGLTVEIPGPDGEVREAPLTANDRIATLTEWLESETPLPPGVSWEWTGDQQEQAESQAFLGQAFAGALGLMFIILLAQFNSFYNSILVLTAVVLSTTGVLIGLLVMDLTFSIIMTGTGVVALAGIVVNNNIVLIDTYQEYCKYMPRLEAITRTAQARIRPVLLTTITTMAGLTPMMLGLSLDFANGGYSIDSPTALWWKSLATAVVFGLGVATVLTLVFTPSVLALRVWITTYIHWFARLLARLSMGRSSRAARDWALRRAARRMPPPEIVWDTIDGREEANDIPPEEPDLALAPVAVPIKAAE